MTFGNPPALREATASDAPVASQRRQWLALAPETWRADLLRIVLLFYAAFGAVVGLPSIWFALRSGMRGVAALDTVAIVTIFVLSAFNRIPPKLRAAGSCLVMYMLGTGLLIGVGSIGEIYLFAFSLMASLLLNVRWSMASILLNAFSMMAIGCLDLAAPEMMSPRTHWDLASWSMITFNFALVNASLVLTLGAIIRTLESALMRAVATRELLEQERRTLVRLNDSLDEEISQRESNEESLRENRALLRIAGRTARLGGWRVELDSQMVVWSDEVCVLHDMPVGTRPTIQGAIEYYAPEVRQSVRDVVAECSGAGTPFDLESTILTTQGARRRVRLIGNAVRDAAGAITGLHGSVQDITQQKLAEARHEKLEEQLRQAQKMETIGSLAGGVAHDFNNLLSVILSYCQLLLEGLDPSDPIRADLEAIRGAGRRANELTRQLLAFSRQQVLAPKHVDLAVILDGMQEMLRRLIGEDVELTTSCAPGLGSVLVDPGQLEQVIMNLAVNARDAMPRGGMLTFETAEVTFDEGSAADHLGLKAGRHIMLAVSDTGIGMDKATQARMFEPFFTTKAQGKGTGLGLATVFGIVRQSGGTIWVYSEPDKGTTFKLYFPIAAAAGAVSTAQVAAPATDPAALRGTETILLVEDEEGVRRVTRTMLRKYGYQVLDAANGAIALALSAHYETNIDLLLTDVVMPRMSGRQLAERLLPLRPEMKVLYMSGYTDDAVVRHGVLGATLAFIQKPLTPEPLALKLREVLDA
jgi:signal transduction histidine kinase